MVIIWFIYLYQKRRRLGYDRRSSLDQRRKQEQLYALNYKIYSNL
jgi:hypothetical protein